MSTGYIINREHSVALGKSVTTVTSPIALTLDMHASSGGNVAIPSGSSITGLTFYGASDLTKTFYPLNDVQCVGGAWTVTVASYSVTPPCKLPIPDCAFACGALGIVALGAAGTVDVELKT